MHVLWPQAKTLPLINSFIPDSGTVLLFWWPQDTRWDTTQTAVVFTLLVRCPPQDGGEHDNFGTRLTELLAGPN